MARLTGLCLCSLLAIAAFGINVVRGDGCYPCENMPPNPDEVGCWGAPIDISTTERSLAAAWHAMLLRNGKVMFIDGSQMANPVALYDPEAGEVLSIFDSPTLHPLGCTGHAQLADGRIVFQGFTQTQFGKATTIYEPDTGSGNGTFTISADNPAARYYPTLTSLADDRLSCLGGWFEGLLFTDPLSNIPNVFDPDNPPPASPWIEVEGAEYCTPALDCSPPVYNFHIGTYPFTYLTSDGYLINVGSESSAAGGVLQGHFDRTRKLDLAAETWTDLFAQPDPIPGGSAVMFDKDRILKAGGLKPDGLGGLVVTGETYYLDAASPTPLWTAVPDMTPRYDHFYLVALADGSVVVVGGIGVYPNPGPNDFVLDVEQLDPDEPSAGWAALAPLPEPRAHHASAVLLVDGTLMSAGSICTEQPCAPATIRIFYPPYLFGPGGACALRPIIDAITGPEADTIHYGTPFFVYTQTPTDIAEVRLIRLGAVTHSFDQEQRSLKLNFRIEYPTWIDKIRVGAPAHGYLAPPGYYMLFIINQNGVPSEGRIVKVGT